MKTHRLSIWSSGRGGTGKTTLTLNLAGALSARGARVLVVDGDPFGACVLWRAIALQSQRRPAFDVAVSLTGTDDNYDWIIFDHCPSRRTAALPGELVLMPVTADSVSFAGVAEGREWVEKHGQRCVLVSNRWRLDRSDHRMALDRYRKVLKGAPVVRDRAVFATAYSRGATIYDTDAGLLHGEAARAEVNAVLDKLTEAASGRKAA